MWIGKELIAGEAGLPLRVWRAGMQAKSRWQHILARMAFEDPTADVVMSITRVHNFAVLYVGRYLFEYVESQH